MTDGDHRYGDHRYWDELAAGHALYALEPAEAAEFEQHRSGCGRCRDSVDELSFVAAQLGSLTAAGDADAPPWRRMRPAVVGSAPGARRRRPWRQRWLLPAATGAAVIAAVTVLAVRLIGSDESPALTVAGCQHDAACHQVVLRTPAGEDAATVLVRDRTATVASVRIGTAAAGTEWVLWQLPRGGQPVFVHAFRTAPASAQSLNTSYADTASFALSEEPAGSHPDVPSRIVAMAPAG
jgi:anti-sigma-K factor RskA